MAENSPTRLPILSILCALHQQLGKFSTPPELYNTLLAYYTGSTSKVDLEILATLTRADVSGIWSLRQQISNEPLRLMRTTEAAIGSLALTTIDSSMAHNTCQAIFADSQQQESPEVYDPELVLSLFAAFVAQPTIDVQDFLACVKSGSLGVLICCMFSSKKGISIGADRLLSRLRLRLQVHSLVSTLALWKSN